MLAHVGPERIMVTWDKIGWKEDHGTNRWCPLSCLTQVATSWDAGVNSPPQVVFCLH